MYANGYGQVDKQRGYGPENDRLGRYLAYADKDEQALKYMADVDSSGRAEVENPNAFQFGGSRVAKDNYVADAANRRNDYASRELQSYAYSDPGEAYQMNTLAAYQNQLNSPQTLAQYAQQRNMNDAYAAQASLAAGAMGGGANAAAAQRMAAMQGGQMAARGANDAAMLGMQERQQLMSGMGALAGQARSSELGRQQYMGARQDGMMNSNRDMEKYYGNQMLGIEGQSMQGAMTLADYGFRAQENQKQRAAGKFANMYLQKQEPGIGDKLLAAAPGAIAAIAGAG